MAPKAFGALAAAKSNRMGKPSFGKVAKKAAMPKAEASDPKELMGSMARKMKMK